MRGTGCSGGAFDYFEPLQGLDGYDVIETVARQPWVLDHKVGMAGISYGGISQLFVAEDRPPSLAAIAPLSVIDSTATTLYPGGILNTGFALSWAKDRVHDAMPASATGGQPWALQRIQGGDTMCAANQVLHASAVDLIAKTRANNFYVPSVADPLDPITFVHKINVPTFMACQFTDEQTGGHCPDLAEHFTGTDRNGSRSPTACTPIRSTPRRSTAGTTSCGCTSRTGPGRSRRRPSVRRCTSRCWAHGVTLPPGPDPVADELHGRA